MSPEELGSYLGLVAGGRLLNHVIHQVELLQSGDEMEIRLLVGESGQPDYAQLATARSRIEALINAGTISRFVIRTLVAETRDLVFVAPGLPPHGYGAFYVRRANAPEVETRAASGSSVLENAHLRVKANPVDGTLTLIDKEAQVLYTGLHRFVDGGDRGDTYNYCQPEEDRLIREPVSPPDIRLIERGAARQTLEIAQLYRLPAGLASDRRRRSDELVDVTLVSRVRLYVGVRRVDIETTVDNRARDHRLRVHFPVRVAVDHAHTATHFYVERRPIPAIPPDLDTGGWIEQPAPTVPQRGWADVSDGRAGLMIANRGLPEMEFFAESGATVAALTLLRCVGWLSREDMHCRQGHAGSGLATPEAQCLDQYTFHYALIPHVGGWEAARTEAEAFRVPLRAIATGIHDGPLPSAERLVHASPPQFYLTAIKQPKGAFVPGLVVRGVNMSDAPLAVRLRPWRRFKQSARVNLNEEFIEPLRPEADGSVLLTARPWEIITVRWRDA
jgi:alpha-mannosidase